MTKWYNYWYRQSWIAAIGLAIVLIVVAALTAGCDPNTADTSQPNCPFGQHAVWKGGTATHAKWTCEKG